MFLFYIGENMLENNVNKNQQIPFQTMQPSALQGQQLPMEAGIVPNPELLQENIQDTYVANRVANTTDDPKGMMWTAALAVPSWALIAKSMDKYAEKCRGNFEDSIPGKIGAWGDRVTESFKSHFPRLSDFLNRTFGSSKKFMREKVIDNSRVLRAFFDTPSKPELAMVLDQQAGMLGFSATDWSQVVENFTREVHYAEDLAGYGATAQEIDAIKSRISGLSREARILELQKAQFEIIKKYSRGGNSFVSTSIADFAALAKEDRVKLLKDAKSYEFGLKDFAEFETINKSRPSHIHRIIESTHNANPKMFAIAYEANPSILGRFKRFLFNREVYGSEFANKMVGSLGNGTLTPEMEEVLRKTGLDKKIPKSALGKFLAKMNNIILEGATNRVAGGKLIAIMQAWFLAEAIYKTTQAEGISDKARTFAERITELVAIFACIPPAIMLMHRLGGIQYAGMTKAQVEAYRNNLKLHNTKAMQGGFASKAEWKASKKALEKELNAGVKNPIVKLFKRIGRIITVGLEQIRPYDAKSIGVTENGVTTYRKGIIAKIKDLFRHPKFGLKQMAGWPMRIALGMMIIQPFLTKLAVKGSHAIFGKPKHSLLDEEKEQEAREQQAQIQQTQIPPQLQQPMNGAVQERNNLLDKYHTNQQNMPVNNDSYTYIPSSEPVKLTEPPRNYVPSPQGVQVKNNEDLTPAQMAMNRADIAEQEALKTLKIN